MVMDEEIRIKLFAEVEDFKTALEAAGAKIGMLTTEIAGDIAKLKVNTDKSTSAIVKGVTLTSNSITKQNKAWKENFKTWLPIMFFTQRMSRAMKQLTGEILDQYHATNLQIINLPLLESAVSW